MTQPQNARRQQKDGRSVRSVALGGMLFALCMALSAAESALTGWVGLPPGVKPGLANVAVMYTLFFLGARPAAALVLLKAAFAVLTRGATAGILSAAGGTASLAVLILLRHAPRLSWALMSVCGALVHNLGQLAAEAALFRSAAVFWYLPVLVVSGTVCGLVSGLLLSRLAPAVNRWYRLPERKNN